MARGNMEKAEIRSRPSTSQRSSLSVAPTGLTGRTRTLEADGALMAVRPRNLDVAGFCIVRIKPSQGQANPVRFFPHGIPAETSTQEQ